MPPLPETPKAPNPYSGRLSNGMLLILLAFPQLFFWFPLAHALRLRFCPPGTFMSGTLRPDFDAALVLAVVSLALLLKYWIVALAPPIWDFFAFQGPGKGRLKHIWSHVWLACFLVSTALFLFAETSSFCLAPNQLTLRYAPWQPLERYQWSDVAAVQTGCVRTKPGEYHFNLYYALIMGDGRAINIADSVPDFEPGFEPMMRAFATTGTHPTLDSRFVHTDCGYRNVGLLTRQP